MRYAVQQHLQSLEDDVDQVIYQNAFESRSWVVRLAAPDVVVLHPTFLGVRWNEDFVVYRDAYQWVRALCCPKLALPQDEYDHSEMLEEWLQELGATHIFSCFPEDRRHLLYPKISRALPFTETLTGYIDAAAADATAKKLVPASARPFDIVYRAAKLPYWFGSHGQLKHRLAALVDEPATGRGLRTDISTRWEDTIFGSKWIDFMLSGRTTIGVESGSSVLDPRGEIQARIRELVAKQPDITFEAVDAKMPPGWDSYAFFAISPRHLEAVVTKTCQVLVEGEYSGVLVPERHYIALRRDLSNLDDVLDRISDVDTCEEIAERAYREIYLDGDYTSKRLAADLRRAAAPGLRPTRLRLPLGVVRTIERSYRPRPTIRPIGTLPGRARRAWLVLRSIGSMLARDPHFASRLVRSEIVRRPAQWRELAADLVRLAALERSWAAGTVDGDQQWWLAAEVTDDTLFVTSKPGRVDPGRRAVQGRFTEIVWDHSAIAAAVPLFPNTRTHLVLGLGDRGLYSFDALTRCGGLDGSSLDSQPTA